jgi:hypothetical protein
MIGTASSDLSPNDVRDPPPVEQLLLFGRLAEPPPLAELPG